MFLMPGRFFHAVLTWPYSSARGLLSSRSKEKADRASFCNIKQWHTNQAKYYITLLQCWAMFYVTCVLYWTLFALVLRVNTHNALQLFNIEKAAKTSRTQELFETRERLASKYNRSELSHIRTCGTACRKSVLDCDLDLMTRSRNQDFMNTSFLLQNLWRITANCVLQYSATVILTNVLYIRNKYITQVFETFLSEEL